MTAKKPSGEPIGTMSLLTLHDLFVQELRGLYHAEQQLLTALPRVAKAASTPELRSAFDAHCRQAEEQMHRLDLVFDGVGIEPDGTPCRAVKGLLEEVAEVIREKGEPIVVDAALISFAQRVAHYEIAAYGSLREYASVLAHDRAVALLSESLEEEMEADRLLSKLARYHVHPAAPARPAVPEPRNAVGIRELRSGLPQAPVVALGAPR